jgi:hypothetical protein
MVPGGLANDDLNASTAQSRSMLVHMESSDTFDLKVYPSWADLRAACGTKS